MYEQPDTTSELITGKLKKSNLCIMTQPLSEAATLSTLSVWSFQIHNIVVSINVLKRSNATAVPAVGVDVEVTERPVSRQ